MDSVPIFLDLSDHSYIEANTNMVVSPLTNSSSSSNGTKAGVTRMMKRKQTTKKRQSPRVVPANKKQKAVKDTNPNQKDDKIQASKKKGRTKLNASISSEDNTEDEKSSSEGDIEYLYKEEGDENEEDEDKEILVDDGDVEDAMARANINNGNQDLQTKALEQQIKFEKQHVVLTPRVSQRVTAVVYTKRYFEIATLNASGQRLMKTNMGKLV